MKMQSNRTLSPFSGAGSTNPPTEVKEVLANGNKTSRDRLLTSADLWNIQRQRKARVLRRYI